MQLSDMDPIVLFIKQLRIKFMQTILKIVKIVTAIDIPAN